MNFKRNKYVILIIISFGIIYSLISIVNHYNFRTFALDLGAYTNSLFDYIHFQWNDSSVFKEIGENLLSDHFDLYLIVFSPLSLLFKTYTLLVVQIFFILFGGLGIYKYFSLIGKTTNLALYSVIYFFLFFGIYTALSFDYHSNVVAASVVPWFFYTLKQRNLIFTSFLLFFILISKENISLWIAFICLGLMIENWKNLRLKKYLFFAFIFCIIYFILITWLVMPAISNNFTYPHFQYSYFGSDVGKAILQIFAHPINSIQTLFINHTNSAEGNYVKLELHLFILFSGLPLLFFKPQYFLMLIPIYFQKLFHDNCSMWGIGGQYSIEFAPILAIGIFSVINDFKNKKFTSTISIIVLISTFICTIRTMDNTVFFIEKARIRIYQKSHYIRNFDVNIIHKKLDEIPKDAIISAQTTFLPHLAYRDYIYQFPIIKDATYIVYSDNENTFPIDKSKFLLLTSSLEKSKDWFIVYKSDELTILKKLAY